MYIFQFSEIDLSQLLYSFWRVGIIMSNKLKINYALIKYILIKYICVSHFTQHSLYSQLQL